MRQVGTATQRMTTVRLQGEALTKILDDLDRASGLKTGQTESRWYRYRTHVYVHLRQPGSTAFAIYSVPTRLLYSRGLVFIHGSFVHTGTSCIAQLFTMHGTWSDAEGLVCRCTHLDGSLHEVETRFDRPLDVSLYCPEAVPSRVLLTDADPLVGRLMAAYLTSMGASVDLAENLTAACELALHNQYDLILVDTELPDADTLEAINELRRRGCVFKIVAALAPDATEAVQNAWRANCDGWLCKPIGTADLERLLQLVREEPLFTTLELSSAVVPLVEEFVKSVRGQCADLWDAYVSGDLERLAKLVRTLKHRAAAYGFEPIVQAAASLQLAMARITSLPELAENVKQLRACCTRVRSTCSEGGSALLGAVGGSA